MLDTQPEERYLVFGWAQCSVEGKFRDNSAVDCTFEGNTYYIQNRNK